MEYLLLANAALFLGLFGSDFLSGDEADEDRDDPEDEDDYSHDPTPVSMDFMNGAAQAQSIDRETLAWFLGDEEDDLGEFGTEPIGRHLGAEGGMSWLFGAAAPGPEDEDGGFDELDFPTLSLPDFVHGQHVMQVILPPDYDSFGVLDAEAGLQLEQTDLGSVRLSLGGVVLAEIAAPQDLGPSDVELVISGDAQDTAAAATATPAATAGAYGRIAAFEQAPDDLLLSEPRA